MARASPPANVAAGLCTSRRHATARRRVLMAPAGGAVMSAADRAVEQRRLSVFEVRRLGLGGRLNAVPSNEKVAQNPELGGAARFRVPGVGSGVLGPPHVAKCAKHVIV